MQYTKKETDLVIEEYTADPCRATVDRLANELDRPIRSIIAKLSSAGVYQPPAKLSKSGDAIMRKEDLAKDIGEWLGIEVPTIAKSGKLDLQKLHKALSDPWVVKAHLVDLEDAE